jgi:hypothetical protein
MITALSRCNFRRLDARSVAMVASSSSSWTTNGKSLHVVDSPCRYMSSDSKKFRPARRPNRKYRPISPRKKLDEASLRSNAKNPLHDDIDPMRVELGKVKNPRDELEATFGPLAADVLRDVRREMALKRKGGEEDPFEEELRMADYLTARTGSTEDLVGERRALAFDIPDEKERVRFMEELDSLVEERQQEELLGAEFRDDEDDASIDPFAEEETGNEGEMDHETVSVGSVVCLSAAFLSLSCSQVVVFKVFGSKPACAR